MPEPRRVLHLIAQSHLDPVWLWPLRDGVGEALTTLQSAVDRCAENPPFQFTFSSAAIYRWVEETDPRLFAAIKELVQAGRWEVIGGWVEQPDCNLPSAESFFRQALFARRYFAEKFGAAGHSTIGYNPDSFGHCGGLPQILRQSGFDAYAFMRPEPWDNPDVPLLFWWEAADGSRVLACRIPTGYSQSYAATADDIEKAVREAVTKCFAPGFDHGVMWFGVGNHGGGPTREHIARVCELQRDPALPELRFSTVREFLAAVRRSPAVKRLPVVRGELGHLFRGCYSANGEVKRLHRASEKALFAAEALSVAAGAGRAANAALAEAWWQFLFGEFHDILAGTCVASTQDETRDRFGAVLTPAREQILRCTAQLARRVDTRGEPGSVLFVANPLPWARRALVQLDTLLSRTAASASRISKRRTARSFPSSGCGPTRISARGA
jgi:alpha-mannosidase